MVFCNAGVSTPAVAFAEVSLLDWNVSRPGVPVIVNKPPLKLTTPSESRWYESDRLLLMLPRSISLHGSRF